MFKGVCYFLPTKRSLEPAHIHAGSQDQYRDLVVNVFQELRVPPPAEAPPCPDRGGELSSAGGECSAPVGGAEMGDLNGGLALQNQKGLSKLSCRHHKHAIAASRMPVSRT